ncbi:hypothetical protein GCM10023322_68530 [Rugosimonospora acidiphila]|uniref:LamG-like jellyroll fold domain-containing protein n=1 Tax=Rugosimonospora acidiphila TaxID=556531 RepID=A0ABP9SJ94_9ACTN
MDTLDDGYGPSPTQDQAMQAAARKASATGKPVVVDALTTETQQVTAQPGGGFSLSGNPDPVRTKQDDTWVPVDTTLHVTANGLMPAATAYGNVMFSDGGTGPLLTTSSGSTRYSLSWPTALPKPTVSGATATYPNVLSGVDLVVSATDTGGFSDVLVVKNAEAAKNPQLADLTLSSTLTGGVHTTAQAPQGIAVASTDGHSVLESASPIMWDSQTATAPAAGAKAATPNTSQALPDPSDTGHPGAAAHIATVQAEDTRGVLRLTPDAGMLTSTSTVYPVYIDPTANWKIGNAGTPAFDEVKQGAPCNGVSLYNNASEASGDSGHLGVGTSKGWPGGCEGIMRAYYQWSMPSLLFGANISSATVNASKEYSATCGDSTVNLHWSGGIGSSTDWNNKPGYLSGALSTKVVGPAGRTGCSPTAPEKVDVGFDATSAVRTVVAQHTTQFTVALAEDAAEASGNNSGFSRFYDNPTLQINYNRIPNTPGAAQMRATNGADNVGCATAAPYPYMGKSTQSSPPALSSTISDPDVDHLQATFKYWINGTSTTHTGLSGDSLASGSVAKYTLPASFTNTLTDGQVVDWQVQVSDGINTSAWSTATCHYTAEPTAPDAPELDNPDHNFPNIDNGGGKGATADTTGYFTVTNTSSVAVTKFVYSLDQPPAVVNPPSYQVVDAVNNTADLYITPYAPGPHTLYAASIDVAGDASAMQTWRFEADKDADTTSCQTLADCFNNTAISPDNHMDYGAADGYASYSATDLTNAGWVSGKQVTIDGATFTLPTYGTDANGQPEMDNVLAANQTIDYDFTAPLTGATSLMVLASSSSDHQVTPGSPDSPGTVSTAPFVAGGWPVAGTYCFDSDKPSDYCPASGQIDYTDAASDSYNLVAPDWISGQPSLAAVTLPHINTPDGQVTDPTTQPKIYAFSIPLQPGKTIKDIVLPDVSTQPWNNTTVLHIFSLATRNTTTATPQPTGGQVQADDGKTWTGAWANPPEWQHDDAGQNFSNLTFRIAVKPTIAGDTVRIKLDNALGGFPLNIGHATIALDGLTVANSQSGVTPSPQTQGAVAHLTFDSTNSASVSIPEGGMVYSNPLEFSVSPNQYVLVSFSLTNTVPYLVEHSWSNSGYEYVTAPGSGDHTADTGASAFAAAGTNAGWFTDILTDLDVQTGGIPTQAVLGDNLTDAWQPNSAPAVGGISRRLSDDIAAAEPTMPAPYGSIAEGIESNQVIEDFGETHDGVDAGGPSILSRIDRDILDQPGLNTVVLNEGLEDILNGQSGSGLGDAYSQLLTYFRGVNVVGIGLTPCGGYPGPNNNEPCGASGGGQTSTDQNRVGANAQLAVILGQSGTPLRLYIDADSAIGVANSTGLTQADPNAATSDHVNLTNAGYAALANAYLGPQHRWALDDLFPYMADSARNVATPYLDNSGQLNEASLTGFDNWTDDPTHGEVLTLDGTTNYAETDPPSTGAPLTVNTTNSFTISAWVKLTDDTPTHDATIAAEDGANSSAFELQYNYSHADAPGWAFSFPTSDGATTVTTAYAAGATTAWTHVVGVYNAATHTAKLYVNAVQAASATNVDPWAATGSFTIGCDISAGIAVDLFPGSVSDLETWHYALNPDQINALYQRIS